MVAMETACGVDWGKGWRACVGHVMDIVDRSGFLSLSLALSLPFDLCGGVL